jgi:hypothetical protein
MSSRAVDPEPHYVKVEGSSAGAVAGTGREKMVQIGPFIEKYVSVMVSYLIICQHE